MWKKIKVIVSATAWVISCFALATGIISGQAFGYAMLAIGTFVKCC
jgi:hypothetical protein